ncbi:MAG: hypothetical protein ABIM99_01275 [Candidatus Dojkabacteria bacterium]
MNKKKIFILILGIIFIFTFIITVFEIITLVNQNNDSKINSNTITPPTNVPTPTSSPSKIDSKFTVSLIYQQPTVNPQKPYREDLINFKSSISSLTSPVVKSIDAGHITVSNQDYTIFISGIGEGTPTNGQVSATDTKVKSNFDSQIYRIDDSNDTDTKDYLHNYGLDNFAYIDYYTDQYNIGCNGQFNSNQYCGTNFITLNANSQGFKSQFSIYCMVNNISAVGKCDEFINNLIITQ